MNDQRIKSWGDYGSWRSKSKCGVCYRSAIDRTSRNVKEGATEYARITCYRYTVRVEWIGPLLSSFESSPVIYERDDPVLGITII